jgi:DNA adenine methylase
MHREQTKGEVIKSTAQMSGVALGNGGGAFVSPLRYPGGKGRLGPWIASLLKANHLEGGCYVEPYAGGAGVAMYLLLRKHVRRIVINDVDPAVYAFWRTIVQAPEALVHEIHAREPTLETRTYARDVLANMGAHSTSEIAFATFFLNRTSRSGILNGGVIGGKAQNGDYKLDARYNRSDLIARIRAIAVERKHIQVYGLDAIDFLNKVKSKLPKKTLIYLDPPYYVKGSQLYRNCYEHEDHIGVAAIAKGLAHPTIITYDDVPAIRKIYKGMNSPLVSLHYSTHTERPLTSEVMFYAGLTLPMPPTMTRGDQLGAPKRSRSSRQKKAA